MRIYKFKDLDGDDGVGGCYKSPTCLVCLPTSQRRKHFEDTLVLSTL